VTRRERPDPGWHAAGWGRLRRWWGSRRTVDPEPEPTLIEHDEEELEAEPPARWWSAALWCAAILGALGALDPRLAGGALVGAVMGGWVARRAAQRRIDQAAHLLNRERATVTARAMRRARRRANKAANAEDRERRTEAARAAKEARRAANRASHRQGSGS
jgi:hypothetical protein